MKPSTTKLKDLPCSTIASEQYTAISKHENIYVSKYATLFSKGLIEWVELTSTSPSQSIGCIGVHYASRYRYTRAALWQKRGAGMRSGSSEWDSSSGEVRRARWGCLHRHRLDAYVHYANRYEVDYLIKARPSPHSNHRRREKNGKDDTNHEIMSGAINKLIHFMKKVFFGKHDAVHCCSCSTIHLQLGKLHLPPRYGFWPHIIDVWHVPSVYVGCEGLSDLNHGPNQPTATIIGEYSASYHHGALISTLVRARISGSDQNLA